MTTFSMPRCSNPCRSASSPSPTGSARGPSPLPSVHGPFGSSPKTAWPTTRPGPRGAFGLIFTGAFHLTPWWTRSTP